MSNFAFVKNKSLQIKLIETYNYIKFLLSLQKKWSNLDEDILISLNRDIIIHTTSVLEWLLTYLLIRIVKKWSEKEKSIINKFVIKKEYKKVNCYKDLNLYKWKEKLYLSVLKETKWKINWKLNIGILIQLVKKLDLFEINLIEWLEDIQKIRNDLHIQKILDEDIYENELTDRKMLNLFKFTRSLQSKVIDKLTLLEV